MSNPNIKHEPVTVTASEAARLLMVTPRRLRQLAADGHVPAAEKGRYPLVSTVRGYLNFIKQGSKARAADNAGAALADAKRREIELRNRRAEAKLIETSDVDAFFADTLSALRVDIAASMKSLDTRVAPLALAAANQAFNRAEARIADALDNLRGGRDPLKDADDEN